jgi:hypothetical protein
MQLSGAATYTSCQLSTTGIVYAGPITNLSVERSYSLDKINTIALAENIASSNEFEIIKNVSENADWPKIYTNINSGVLPAIFDAGGFPLKTWNNFRPITAEDSGSKLFNAQFFQATIDTTGCHTITVTPTGA